jgi:nucleotide-binding universal stress UspA family protein
MYKSILVHVDPDQPGAADRITAAAHLAQDCHAKLIGVAASLPAATVELIASGAAAVAAGVMIGEQDELNQRFALARAEFTRWTEGLSVQTEWQTIIGFPAQAIAAKAGRADLIVIGPPQKPSVANSYLDCGELIMRAGRPVLALPHGTTKLDVETAVVAWRNTRESRRALADALPLLATARQVHLIHVREVGDDSAEQASLTDADAFLEAHSIAAETQFIDAARMPPAQHVLSFADRSGAGLIVSGAYGHTRIREWAFGGVTRELMYNCPVACLFSH